MSATVREERLGSSRLRVSARSRVSAEMARQVPRSERGLGLPVLAGQAREGVESAATVGLLPTAQGGYADGFALGVGDVVCLGGDGLAQLFLGAVALPVVAQQRQYQSVAKERYLCSPVLVGRDIARLGQARRVGWF
jgi:hypothetical protein